MVDQAPAARPPLKSISLFAGCGGLSLGFRRAGFNIMGYVELDKGAREIYEANFPNTPCLGTDIREVTDKQAAGWRAAFGEIDVLYGGPPCQGFSLTGKRDQYDPRNELYKEFARIAAVLQPRVVVLENVRLLTSMKTRDGQNTPARILEAFESAGYSARYQELNAQHYGVPQFRERVFFIGVRKDADCQSIAFPNPTHGDPSKMKQTFFDGPLQKWVTFRDATADLEPLESGERSATDPWHFAVAHPEHVIKWLKDVPEGKSAHENADPALRPPSGYNTTYKRIKWDEPCSTIGTTFGMISASRNVHPIYTRSLTVREALRCQTFPDDFKLHGKLQTVRTVIGNAVPPLLAQVIAEHVRDTLLIDR